MADVRVVEGELDEEQGTKQGTKRTQNKEWSKTEMERGTK